MNLSVVTGISNSLTKKISRHASLKLDPFRSLHYLRASHSGNAWLRGSVEILNNDTCGVNQRTLKHQTVLNLQQTSDKDFYILTVSSDNIDEEPNGHLYKIVLPRLASAVRSTSRSADQKINAFSFWCFHSVLVGLLVFM